MRRPLLALVLLALVPACTGTSSPSGPTAVVAEVPVPNAPSAITHGNDPLPPRPPGLIAQAAPQAAWPCEGTGVEGRRVQLVYAHTGSGTLAAFRPTFEAIARQVEGTFLTSARETGGERLVRFVTDAGCNLSILDVVVSMQALASFDQTIAELSAQGLNRTDRIYHTWTEGNAYCGIGTVYSDDTPTGNINDRLAQYSRSDRQCWNYAEAHEITHNLGGVQNSAPNSTLGLHCRDDYDVMCYADGGPNGQMIQPYPCPDATFEDRLDCGDNDYFSTAPPAGSYLASHWNTANAGALTRSVPSTSSTLPPSTSSTTLPPTTSTTTGTAKTSTDLMAPSKVTSGQAFDVIVRVTGGCRPEGVVEIRVSDRLMTSPVLVNGAVVARLTITGGAARPTIRASYRGEGRCASSSDTTRPRVV